MNDSSIIHRDSCPLCGETKRRFLLEKEGGTYVECPGCRLVYTDPAPCSNRLKDVSDEWATKHHAGDHRKKWEGNSAIQEIVYGARMRRINSYRRCNRLLDVGCSTGEFLGYAKTQEWDVTGCELAKHTAAIAQERVGCEVRVSSFEDAGFVSASFDVVTMWDVLEHLFDPSAVLREVWRILRPGGMLALNTPNYNSLSRLLLGKKWEAIIPPRHLFVFSPATIKKFVHASGGKAVAIQSLDINPMDIISGIIRGKKYGFDTRQRNIGRMKDLMLRHRNAALVRNGINRFLNATRLGDVLEVYAERVQ